MTNFDAQKNAPRGGGATYPPEASEASESCEA